MVVVTPQLVQDKNVLLRLDIDVPLRLASLAQGFSLRLQPNGKPSLQNKWEVVDDFRLKAGLPTLRLCLEHAKEVVIMGHIGRPDSAKASSGKPNEFFDQALSVAPIYEWLEEQGFSDELGSGKLKLLENLRFEKGEEGCDLEYARELPAFGDFFVNEAFAAHHPAASTTILPTLLPHAAGLRFAQEVGVLTKVREASRRPLVVIIGGVKLEDKLPAVLSMAKIADYVLVGGKIAAELSTRGSANILVAELNKEGTDVTEETISSWKEIINGAKIIVWNGPIGKVQNLEEMGSERGTYELAKIISDSDAETVVGGGDTVGFLDNSGLLDKFSFVSTGGGAMLEFLTYGTMPTIEVLK